MILTRKRAIEVVYAVNEVLRGEQVTGGLGEHIGPKLDGACMAGSALTTLVLKEEGVPAGAMGGFYHPRRGARGRVHWWTETACGWILDPTVTQFGKRLNPIATQSRERHVSVQGLVRLFYLGGDDLLGGEFVTQGYAFGMPVVVKKPGPFKGSTGFLAGEEDDGRFLVELDGQSITTGLIMLILGKDEFTINRGTTEWRWMSRCYANDLPSLAEAFFRMAYRLGISETRARAELGWNREETRSLAA